MNTKTDPFTRTPGVAGQAYIDNGVAEEIITAFCNPESEKYVYKITGLRGSGKSVEYSRIIRFLKEKKGWLVYPLSASGEAVSTLLSKLSREKFIRSDSKSTTVSSTTSVGGSAVVISGNETVHVSRSYAENEHFYSAEAALTDMVKTANEKKYKVLVGVDDISKTPETVRLLSMIGSMILEGLKIYLVVTGLSDNIEDFSTEKNLSFFKRADAKEIRALNRFDMTYMYEKLLGVDSAEAKELACTTMGYAYAYQVLGSLYFEKKDVEATEDILSDFERILFKDCYELIWQSLSPGEKDVARYILQSKTGKAEEIKKMMRNPSTYPVYRERLINKHLVDGTSRGYLKINLPRFDKFIELWGEG